MYWDGAYAVSTPFGEAVSDYKYINPQPFTDGVGICQDIGGNYCIVGINGEEYNTTRFDGLITADGNLFIGYRNVGSRGRSYTIIDGKEPTMHCLMQSIGDFPKIPENWTPEQWINVLRVATKFDEIVDVKWRFIVLQKGKYYTVIDNNTQEIVKNYDYIENFVDGIARTRKDGHWGLIDSTGNEVVVPTKYQELKAVRNGLVICSLGNRWELIHIDSGKIIDLSKYEEVRPLGTDFFKEKREEKWYLIGKNGKEFSKGYDGIDDLEYDMLVVEAGNMMGLINSQGKETALDQYEDVEVLGPGLAYCILRLNLTPCLR